MLRRRLERHVREASDAIARELAEQVHARFQDWSIDAVTRPRPPGMTPEQKARADERARRAAEDRLKIQEQRQRALEEARQRRAQQQQQRQQQQSANPGQR